MSRFDFLMCCFNCFTIFSNEKLICTKEKERKTTTLKEHNTLSFYVNKISQKLNAKKIKIKIMKLKFFFVLTISFSWILILHEILCSNAGHLCNWTRLIGQSCRPSFAKIFRSTCIKREPLLIIWFSNFGLVFSINLFNKIDSTAAQERWKKEEEINKEWMKDKIDSTA